MVSTRTSPKAALRWFTAVIAASAVFLAITYLGWAQKEQRIQLLMQMLLLAGGFAIVLYGCVKKAPDTLCLLILFGGLVIRFGYALYTPTTVRFHDLAPIDAQATGHAGYVLNLFLYHRLPDSNLFQFAQPPLYYTLSALAMKVYQLGTGLSNPVELFEAARLPSLLASCGALFLSYRIGQTLRLNRRGTAWLLTVCAFLPNHYLLAGRANPDSLAVFFVFWVVLYSLKWFQSRSLHDLFLLALGFGLGMMTKMTVAVLAIPVGIMMFAVFYRRCIRAHEWKLVAHFALFLAVAAPLGLWHPIRNAMLYAQPLGYVFEMSLNDPQYVGTLSLWQRFGFPSLQKLFTPLYIDGQQSANVWLYTAKTAVFGEFSYEIDNLIPLTLFTANLFLMAGSAIATVAATVAAIRRRNGERLLLAGIGASVLASYLLFNLRYPFCCSMDYRYAVGTSLIGALMLSLVQERLSHGKAGKAVALATEIVLTVFAAASIVMYTNIV